jgi:hypothetical protein
VKKGLIVGVAVGGLLYVMWRRRRAGESPAEPQTQAWHPPAPAAAEPAAEAEPAAGEEITEELDEEPDAEPEPEPEAESLAVDEAVAPAAAPKRVEPTLRHPGRQLPLTSSGFAAKPRMTAFHSSDRPQAAQARISWPGTGGPAAQRPKPLRLVPTRARPAALRRSR